MGLVSKRLVGVKALLMLLSASAFAAASEEEAYTPYEQETVDMALERHDAAIEPSPEGKRIVAIEIDVLDVFEDRDPMFNFVNVFHANTKDYVIRRELLFEEGHRYLTKKIRESERNIRGIRQQSLVLIIPLRTDDPDTVKILVIAKDIWSLRLNSDYRIQNGQLERLLLQPAEENLAGTHRRALLNFLYEPDVITFGAAFIDPRLAGTRHTWTLSANAIVNHDTGEVEGGSGAFTFGRPLFSLSTPWSWGASATYSRSIARQFSGLVQNTFPAQDPEDPVPSVAYEWEQESLGGSVTFTRSYGYAVKNNFRMGMAASRTVFRPTERQLTAPDQDPEALAAFVESELPFGETRNGPVLSYNVFLNDYLSITDAETMGLQENYQLGPDLVLRFQPISRAFGSTRDILNYTATGMYTAQLGAGYARAYASADIETELTKGQATVTDSTLQAGIRVVTPPFFIGRLVYDGTVLVRPDNFTNRFVRVGGDTRLRGYPSLAFRGENLVASNLEFRSRSFTLWSVLVRGALFYDVGDAFDGDAMDLKHGAGFGLRVLFPQLGRAVMRLDWGFPLDPDVFAFNPFQGLLLTFRQAFGVPTATTQGVEIGTE